MLHHSFIHSFSSFNTYFILGTMFTYSVPLLSLLALLSFWRTTLFVTFLKLLTCSRIFSRPNKGLQMQTYRIIKKYHEGSNLIWNIYFSKLPRPHSSHTHPCFRVLLALHLCAETALSLRYSFLGFSDPQILYSGSSNEDVKFKLFFPYF